MRTRMLSLLLTICMLCSMLPAMPAAVLALPYDSNLLINSGGSTSTNGWVTHNLHMNGQNFESNNGDQMWAYQDYWITDAADKFRVDAGQYKISASAWYWAQGSSTIQAYIKVMFYDGNDNYISEANRSEDKYRVGAHNITLSVNDVTIPANTRKIRYQVKNNCSLAGRVEIQPHWMKIVDTVDPRYEGLTSNTADGSYRSNTIINYKVKFTEPVSIVSEGYLPMSTGGQAVFAGQSEDKTTLSYSYTIPSPESGKQIDASDAGSTVKPTKIMNVTVKDDASRSITLNEFTDRIYPGDIKMDNKPPVLSRFTTEGVSANASYKAGDSFEFVANFHEFVKVKGTAEITLSGGGKAIAPQWQESDTSTSQVIFTYTVKAGENSETLTITDMNLSGIVDVVGQSANESPSYADNIAASKPLLDKLNINVDTTPPSVTFNPVSVENWIQTLNVALSPEDNITGVKNIWAAWTVGEEGPIWLANPNVSTDDNRISEPLLPGEYKLHIKAADKVGNEKTFYSGPYRVDAVSPAVTLSRTNIAGTQVVSSLTATATDTGSGIHEFRYSWIDNDGVAVLTEAVPEGGNIPSPTDGGTYTVEVTAIDNATNSTTQTEVDCVIDADAPIVSFSLDGNSTVAQQHASVVSVVDNLAGIREMAYQWSDSLIVPGAQDSGWISFKSGDSLTTPSSVESTYFLYVRAIDQLGNERIVRSQPFVIDNIAPEITMSPNGNSYDIGLSEYEMAVAATDQTSAQTMIVREYMITSSEETPETGWQKLTDTGLTVTLNSVTQYVHIRATDGAGNVRIATSLPYVADSQVPIGRISRTSVEYSRQPSITVKLAATDDHTSTDSLKMKLIVDDVAGEWEDFVTEKTLQIESEGVHNVTVLLRDRAGNEVMAEGVASFVYDITAPVVAVDYSTTKPTNGEVTAIANATDNITAEPVALTEVSKLFLDNGSFVFRFHDQAGNIGEATALVDWFDRVGPVITIETEDADGQPHKKVTAKIAASDKNGIGALQYRFTSTDSWTDVPSDGVVTLHSGDGVRTLEVRAEDTVGNEKTASQVGFVMDNTLPTPSVTYAPASRTAQHVVTTITFDETTSVTNNNGKTSYTFTDNGSFTFEFTDQAGNSDSYTAEVDWIDRTIPSARVDLKTASGKSLQLDEWTNEDMVVSLIPPARSVIEAVYFNGEPIMNQDEQGLRYIYFLPEYGSLTYTTHDTETLLEGNGEVIIHVDKEAPTVTEIVYSTETWISGDVLVTVRASDLSAGVIEQSHVFTANGTYTFVLTDVAGNVTNQTVQVDMIDKDVPKPVVTWTTANGHAFDPETMWTNQDVTVTLTFPDEPAGMDPMSHTFTDNGSYLFTLTDIVGNTTTYNAVMNRIDRNAPVGYAVLNTSGWTNRDVTATLFASDDKSEVTSVDEFKHVFAANGTYTFVFTDAAGNRGTVSATAERIDKIAPVLSHTLTPLGATAYSVYATVTADEPVTILNNGGKPAMKFSSNGSFTFRAVDRAGNQADREVIVSNITRETTPVVIDYSTDAPTGGVVVAAIRPEQEGDRIYLLNNAGLKSYTFHENGEFTFRYINDAGVEGAAIASVSNIDKSEPKLSASYSTTVATNEAVIVTLTADKEVTWPYGCEGGIVTFDENGARRVTVTDALGNKASITLRVNNIDRVAPVITIVEANISVSIGSTVDLTAGVTAMDNIAVDGDIVIDDGGFDPTVAGSYIVTYSARDAVGNIAAAKKTIAVYDPNAFNLIVNGKMAAGAEIRLNSNTLDLSFVNAKGEVTVKYLGGKQAQGAFKKGGEVIDGTNITLSEAGYYTFYAVDEMHQFVLVQVFVV